MRHDRLPLTYDESRARFLHAARGSGAAVTSHPIEARGPRGLELTIDTARVGAADPERVLLVLSGVHGVEGFVCSALQADLLDGLGELPSDMAVIAIHAVNPWGMAWWRRQNESNVDLNRNWQRDRGVPFDNDAYDELHPLACPDSSELPDVGQMLAAAQSLVEARGLAWVRDGITVGQYRHPDGLHYGGARTEESNRILEAVVPQLVGGATRVMTVDLHTGHGPWGELTALSEQPPGSPQDTFHRAWCDRVEATSGNPDATTARKAGPIAGGLAAVLPDATCFAATLEVGTADDLTQLGATYQEQWVHRRADRSDPKYKDVVWAYRCCFTPDDASWEQRALTAGREHLTRAVEAVAGWAS
ncbi:MAG TPA: DUF2817 domain-containing protein [Acidimicrobiales bacterium]|nr:DUF2817 domain-containing protein [Acidimicrobiales bacterium]